MIKEPPIRILKSLLFSRINEKVPALHRIGEESFKDDILERLKDKPTVVVFAEPNVSYKK